MSNSAPTELTGFEVAIIGMAGRFPGAPTIAQLWRNLCEGVESISLFTDEELRAAGVEPEAIADPNAIKYSGYVADSDKFDAAFFGFTPREARMMDPQQRLFLECCWEALETAGYTGDKYKGAIGVFAGMGVNTYLWNNLNMARRLNGSAEQYQQIINNDREFFSTRASYKLNLTGPSITMQCACSTSLVATHLAWQSVVSGESDMALAGGVSIRVPQQNVYVYQEGSVFAPDGHCRPFDAKAQGMVVSNGAGIVVLKRLADAIEDGDTIYAVIKGSAINNDGANKSGYTAPSREGQARVIRAAQNVAEVEPDTISFVETHGTATLVGDPIEVSALTQAFRARTDKRQFCALGSIKSNIGHADTAAGVAGLIKATLAVKHGLIPPTLHFTTPNPNIDFESSPFYVNSELIKWPENGHPRRAGVSAFGFGGTNAHMILEEAPPLPPPDPSKPKQLLILSARTRSALNQATSNLAAFLRANPDVNLADVAYTLQMGRKEFAHRRVVVASSVAEAAEALEQLDPQRVFTGQASEEERPLIFMFPAQGTQHINMAAELYKHEPVFRQELDRCAELLIPMLGLDMRTILFPSEDRAEQAAKDLVQTITIQPILFSIEYALAQLWLSRGLKPHGMIGHSFGEYAAACVAGVFSLPSALRLMVARGRLMQEMPTGNMMTVPLPASEIVELMGPEVDIAAINGPALCVVSGPSGPIRALEKVLTERGVNCRMLPISHAGHSSMMEPIVDRLSAEFEQIEMSAPQIPYMSNLSGTWITAEEATNPRYWGVHLRKTVRFDEGLAELFKLNNAVFLEVGPGIALSTAARRHPSKTEQHIVLNSLPRGQDEQSDLECFLTTAGRLWIAGISFDWSAFYTGEKRRRIPLPTYPFERQRHWIDAVPYSGERVQVQQIEYTPPALEEAAPSDGGDGYQGPRTPLEQKLCAVWQKQLGLSRIGIHDNFFDLGGDSLLAIELVSNIQKTLQVELSRHSLLRAPTIAQLSEILAQQTSSDSAAEEQASSPEQSLLVPFQSQGHKRPLFLIHPIGGGVYIYRDLAQQLGRDRPIYGIQAQGFDGTAEPLTSIEEMAELYIKLIRSVQPEGPYLIGGSSFGGIISFEMAHQLKAAGQQVDMLMMIDTPDVFESAKQLNDQGVMMAAVLSASPNLPSLLEQLQQLPPEEQMAFAEEQMRSITDSGDNAGNNHLLNVLTVHIRAMRQYKPQPYDGCEVLFFRAKEHDVLYPPNPERGWVDITPEGLLVYDIPGNHISMNQPPNVQVMAQKLKRYMSRFTY